MTEMILIVQLLANLVITTGIEQRIFHRLGDPMYTTGSRTVVFGFCLCNPPLLYLYSNKIIDRYSLLHLYNFSIYHDVTTEGSKK